MVTVSFMPDDADMNDTTVLTVQRTATDSAAPGHVRFAVPISPTRSRHFDDLRRDRVADLIRVAALGVVVIWHSTLSLFHRNAQGVLRMPNPIGDYRGLWMLTWVLQVMPLFFVVSGAVNADAWRRHRRRGGNAWSFSSHRITRFAHPLIVFAAGCGLVEGAAHLLTGDGIMARYIVILVPLWTLALLVAYAPVTPMLDKAWRRYGASTTVCLMSVVILSDLIRFRSGAPFETGAEVVSTIGVWLVAYHLGWVYRSAVDSGTASAQGTGRIMAMVGFVGMVVTTNIGIYPRAMVATSTDAMSNLLPTTAPIMFLALFQCGLLLLVRPHLNRWLPRDGVRRRLDTFGAYALPAYLFHMVAVVLLVLAAEAAGVDFTGKPSAAWWLTRPIWLVGIIAFLVPILTVAGRLLSRK